VKRLLRNPPICLHRPPGLDFLGTLWRLRSSVVCFVAPSGCLGLSLIIFRTPGASCLSSCGRFGMSRRTGRGRCTALMRFKEHSVRSPRLYTLLTLLSNLLYRYIPSPGASLLLPHLCTLLLISSSSLCITALARTRDTSARKNSIMMRGAGFLVDRSLKVRLCEESESPDEMRSRSGFLADRRFVRLSEEPESPDEIAKYFLKLGSIGRILHFEPQAARTEVWLALRGARLAWFRRTKAFELFEPRARM